jgi:integrase
MGIHTSLVKKRVRNGVTRLIIDFHFTNKSGERVRFVRHAELQTRDGAEKEAARYHERAILTGDPEPVERSTMTLSLFYESVFKPKVLPLYRKNTRIRYEALWRQRVEREFGAKRLHEIDEADFRRFARSIELEKRKAKGPVAFLRTLLREAAQHGIIETAPRVPAGIIKDAKKLPSAPTLAEVEALILKASGWLRLALALGVYAGLRSGEIRALRIGDIDLDGGAIRIVRALSDDEEEAPKGDKERTVPVVPQLAEILGPAIEGKPAAERVLLTRLGTTPRRQHVLGKLVELQRRLGTRRTWSVHALRHAFCSHLVRVGIGVEAVRALAGHSSIRVTNRYVHATGADLQGAMGRGFRRPVGDWPVTGGVDGS